MSDLTVMSSKGQIVVPKNLREELGLRSGTAFAIFGKDDTIILKKVDVPSARETFSKIHKWGVKFAKRKGLEEGSVERIIHEGRGVKSG